MTMLNSMAGKISIDDMRRSLAVLLAVFVVVFITPNAARAQIAFRSAAQASAAAGATGITFNATGSTATAASGNVTPGLPGGFAAGDVHICLIES